MTAFAHIDGGGLALALTMVGVGFWLVLQVVFDTRAAAVRTRLRMLVTTDHVPPIVRRSGEPSSRAPWLPLWLRSLFVRADFKPSASAMIGIPAAHLLGFAVSAYLMSLMMASVLAIAAVAAEIAVLRHVANRRVARFAADLPGFLERVVQLIRVGNSLSQAIARSTESSPRTVRTYLLPAVRRIDNGASVDQALYWLAERLDNTEFHMFVLAVEVNLLYGARLTDTISFIIQTLKTKHRVERDMQAATSETRASAWVIGILPIVVTGLMWGRSDDYFDYFVDTHQGHLMLSIAASLQGVGFLLLNRMLKVPY